MITENSANRWSSILKEELGVTDQNKLAWMSQLARNHEVYEGLQTAGPVAGGIYGTPLNTTGMGNPMMPVGVGYNATDGGGIGDTGADFSAPQYKVGSGDIPMSTLTISMEVAARTIGLELVGVVPANGPWAMLQYLDFPYAGGKLGKGNLTSLDGKGQGNDNKPIYIKISAAQDALKTLHDTFKTSGVVAGSKIDIKGTGGVLSGKYMGKSRINNAVLVEVLACTVDGDPTNTAASNQVSIADVFASDVQVQWYNGNTASGYNTNLAAPAADFVATAADHVQGFSNFFNGADDPMTRAQNETGVGNTIGARFYSKMVQMGSYEVTGTVTRQQLQDLPLYGIDVVGKVIEAMQNELTQAINNRILDRVFKLGVSNATAQKNYQNVDLNIYVGNAGAAATKNLADFAAASKFVGIDGQNHAANWGAIQNAIQNTAAESTYTLQRRIMSRILAASNLIANTSRVGRGNWVVTNTQVLSALQDCAGFVVAPMQNSLDQSAESIYCAGSVAGMNIYVDPYMTWEDTRVLVGRRSNGTTPGVIFMPYILMDKVQTVIEGTMAPKLLANSRFAIVSAGLHPEFSYMCFMIDCNNVNII